MFHKLLSRDHETGNPLVADAACGAGLSGLSRRSFSEDGSAASAKRMGVPRAAQALAPRAGQPSRGTAGLVRGVPERYVAGGACPACPERSRGEPVEGTPEDARLPAPLPARRAYRPEGRAYSSERRTPISVVAVTPRREFMKYPGWVYKMRVSSYGKRQPGVFFGAEGAHMLSPGDVVVALSDDLGGGYLYGRPEHLAKAFDAAGATQGSAEAEYLFVKKRSCLW